MEDKIREEFESDFSIDCIYDYDGKWYTCDNIKKPTESQKVDCTSLNRIWHGYRKGYKAASLLPTEKVCPECGGSGAIPCMPDGEPEMCETCNGTGHVQQYYTPEQYEKIVGNQYPDDALVWHYWKRWTMGTYDWLKDKKASIVIVQTAQKCPEVNYRVEDV